MCACPRKALEIRQSIECDVHLAGRTSKFITANVRKKLFGKLAFFHEVKEGEARINTGGDHISINLVSILESHTLRAVVLDDEFGNGRLSADLCAGFAGSVCNGVGNCPGATSRKPPGAERAINLSHVMVQQNVSRTRRANAQKSADNARCGHCSLERVGLKPLVEKVH